MTTLDDLQAEFAALEHEWFLQRNFDRPTTAEMMDKMVKIAGDALRKADDVAVEDDFAEMRKELKHRVGKVIDEEVK